LTPDNAADTFGFLHQPAASGELTPVKLPAPGAGVTQVHTIGGHGPVPQTCRKKKLPTVPGYEILRELGRGGMGVVYLARQMKLHRPVALKMILAGVLTEDEDLARFQSEAEILSQFQHPNIVQVFEVGDHEGYAYFSMEYVPGGTLSHRLRQRPLAPRDAAYITCQLALAVQAAHDQGVIHRDLKPANVLLQPKTELLKAKSDSRMNKPDSAVRNEAEKLLAEDGTASDFGSWDYDYAADTEIPITDFVPKVTDFGLAKRLQAEGLTQTGVILGTPEYMAPEQAMGLSPAQGPAVDIYALGAVLYELLTGRPPFKGASPMDTIQQVVTEELVPPSRLQPKTPRDLETICLKCLRKESMHRYISAQALGEDLGRFLDGKPILARPAGPLERLDKWARRKPALAALLGTVVLAVVLLSVAVVFLWRTNEAEARQRKLAERNAERAKENARLAKEAVDGLSMLVTDEPPFNEEPMRGVRRRLLEKALPFYEKFEAELSEDRQVLEDAATHRFRLAVITEEMVGKALARDHYASALRLWQKLAAAYPNELRYRHEEARSLIHLSRMHYRLGHYEEAETSAQQALKLGEHLTKVQASEPAYRKTLADAALVLAMVQRSTGEPHAQANCVQALRLYEQLAAQSPKDMALLAQVAATWNHLGELLEPSGKRPLAIKHFETALKLYQQVTAAQPGVSTYQADMASVYNNLGTAHRHQRHAEGYAAAEKYVRQELVILDQLTAKYPEVIDYQARLMAAWERLGSLQLEPPASAEAEVSLRKALEINRRLVKTHPAVLDYQVRLAWVLYYLAAQASNRRQTAEALEWLPQADVQLTRLERQYPQEVQLRELRRLLHRVWAITLEEGGRYAEAIKEWDRAHAASDRRRVEFLHHQGVCMARIGDFAGAARVADEVENHHNQNGVVLVELTRIHALCYSGVTDIAAKERHAAAALQALRRAKERNHLRQPEHQKALREQEDFAPLRQRKEIQTFLKELPPPDNP
jgi:eukaryotic-like serine/threonine-protein kinase